MIKRYIQICMGVVLGRGATSLILKNISMTYRRYFKGGYFGLNGIDARLEKFVDHDNGFYVELGANDGVTQSNSLYFELMRGWKGVLVEPAPHNYLACCELRGKNNSIFCNACVSFDCDSRFVEMQYADLMSISLGVSLDLDDIEEHLSNSKSHLKSTEKHFTFGAIAMPLNDILIASNAPQNIDFLSLDVEGAELEVLKGVDFKMFKFKYMLIECRDIERLEIFLNEHSYKLQEKLSKHDYLFTSN